MRFSTDIKSSPNRDSINPELVIELKLMLNKLSEFPFEIEGELYTKRGEKKIGNISQVFYNYDREIEIGARNLSYHNEEIEFPIKFIISLSRKSLDFIQHIRSKTTYGDVELNLKLDLKMIYSSVNISHLKFAEFEEMNIKRPNP